MKGRVEMVLAGGEKGVRERAHRKCSSLVCRDADFAMKRRKRDEVSGRE